MEKTSKSLNGWANTFVVTGVILLIVAFFGWIFTSDSVAGTLSTGIVFIFVSPVIRGLSVLVQNAEQEMDMRKTKNMINDNQARIDD